MEDPELVHAYGLARCWAIGTGIMVERETPKEATEQLTPLKFLLLKMFFLLTVLVKRMLCLVRTPSAVLAKTQTPRVKHLGKGGAGATDRRRNSGRDYHQMAPLGHHGQLRHPNTKVVFLCFH